MRLAYATFLEVDFPVFGEIAAPAQVANGTWQTLLEWHLADIDWRLAYVRF
jgi:hypothetical protein